MTTVKTQHHGKYEAGINSIVYQNYLRPADGRQNMLIYEVMIEQRGIRAPVGEYDEYQIRSVIHDLRSAIAAEAPTFDMPIPAADDDYPLDDDLQELRVALECLSF